MHKLATLKYNLEVALLKYLSFIGPHADYLAFPFKMLRLPRVILTFVLIYDINAGVENKLNVGQIDIIQMTTGGERGRDKQDGGADWRKLYSHKGEILF